MIARAREELATATTNHERAEARLHVLREDPHLTEADAQAAITSRDQAKKALDEAQRQVDALAKMHAEEEEVERLSAQTFPTGVRSPGVARITSEPAIYRRGDHQGASWVRDMIGVSLRADADAADRLRRNNKAVAQEVRALNTTDTSGGDFVPPVWLMNEMATYARAGRVAANLVRNEPLPGGTDAINLPKVTGGTAVAEQGTQNNAVQNTDATTATVTSNIATIAGQQVVSVQLIEQSPVNMDEVLLRDLMADLAQKIDVFCLNNNVANKRGLLNVSGINAVTFTSASPTAALAYSKVADAIQRIHTGRFLPPDTVLMHPRRWAWFLASLDSQNRPLVVPNANGPMNAEGIQAGVSSEGYVGSLQGLPVYVDANIPVNLGAGTNQDPLLVFRRDDHILFEGTPKAEAFREPLAANLSILLRVYNYIATAFERYPSSISVVNGTGTVAPTF